MLRRLLRALRRPSDADVARELRDHLELDAEQLASSGAREPAYAARRRFGNAALVAETVRGVWRFDWLEQLAQDLRHGWRGLLGSPVYAITATITLSLGIGAAVAVFSLADPIVNRPYPLLPQDQLVYVTQPSQQCPSCDNASVPAYVALRDRAKTLSGVAAGAGWDATLESRGGSELVDGYRVTANLWSAISAPFALGRGFAPGDDRPGAPHVAVLSYDFWLRRFARSPGVLDSTITLVGEPYQVVGVLAQHVVFPTVKSVYVPFVFTAADYADHGSRWIDIFARLAPGSSLAQAHAEAAAIARQLALESPLTDSTSTLSARPLKSYHTDDVVLLLRLFGVAVGLVLFAACMSVANLALARAAARRRELAVRAALGGRRGRLVRHLLAEALIVALAGGVLGLALAEVGTRALHDALPESMSRFVAGWALVSVDARAVAFALATCIGSMLLFAVLPAVRASRVDLATVLTDGGRTNSGGVHGTRLRSALVVIEVSVALVLLTAAGLLTRSVHGMFTDDPGVRLDHVLNTKLQLPRALSTAETGLMYRRLDERLHAVPGVLGAGFTSTTPLSNNFWGTHFEVPGRPDAGADRPSANDQRVSPDYFRTMGIRVLSGRGIEARDDSAAGRVAVINRFLADKYFPREDPVGRTIVIGAEPWTIVGVSSNVYHGGFDEPLRAEIDRPLQQVIRNGSELEIWTAGDPGAMRDAVRHAIADVNPAIAVGEMRTMRDIQARHVSPFRMMASVLVVFAAVTLLIAIVALYGVVAYGVAQRQRELGVRIALGAGRGVILAQVAGGALRLTATGVGIGAAGAFAFAQLLKAMLYGVRASDPVTPLASAAVLLAVSVIAALVPARAASRVDPVVVMRE